MAGRQCFDALRCPVTPCGRPLMPVQGPLPYHWLGGKAGQSEDGSREELELVGRGSGGNIGGIDL